MVVGSLGLGGCDAARPSQDPQDEAVRPSVRSGRSHAITDEPWSFDGRAGRAITTPHYRVYTTRMQPEYLGRLPAFLESALQHYRTVVTQTPLPVPPSTDDHKLSTYVFRTRGQWERMTRQLLGDDAAPFLRIQRGGYAWGGAAVLYEAGDGGGTLWSIAAHEGWHQFTQRTFKQSLPTWLEEAIATLCEGQRWKNAEGVEFIPRDNPERHTQLAALHRSGRLRSVERLLLDSPADLAARHHDAALDYYAQVWALGLMLRERHPAQLAQCVEDAACGNQSERLVLLLDPPRTIALTHFRALAIAEAYFGGTPALESEYRAFVATLVDRP